MSRERPKYETVPGSTAPVIPGSTAPVNVGDVIPVSELILHSHNSMEIVDVSLTSLLLFSAFFG